MHQSRREWGMELEGEKGGDRSREKWVWGRKMDQHWQKVVYSLFSVGGSTSTKHEFNTLRVPVHSPGQSHTVIELFAIVKATTTTTTTTLVGGGQRSMNTLYRKALVQRRVWLVSKSNLRQLWCIVYTSLILLPLTLVQKTLLSSAISVVWEMREK